MTPARKTTAILLTAGLVAVAASLLTMAARSPRAAATDGANLIVRAQLQSSHVLVGTGEAHMAVTINAPRGGDAAVRPRLNLAIVIDRSGSMSGEKIEHAKLAARQLVSRLQATDRFAVIAYGSDVDVVFASREASPAARERALAAINDIYDDGGTNLSGGLIAGRDEVLPHRGANRVSRIVLISDGMANEGISDGAALAQLAASAAERGVSITTVGVGLDFDETTMTRLAVAGAGSYYFVENSDALVQIFDDELRNVGATVATEITVALTPADGVAIEQAYGYEIVREGNRSIISVADLHAGETRKVVLRLQVTANQPGGIDIANVEVGYHNLANGSARRVAIRSRAEATGSDRAVLDHSNKDATLHIERAKTARSINQATALYEQGDIDGARQLLGHREAEASQLAADIGYEDLDEETQGATDWAARNMRAAPSARGAGGSRAKKSNRKSAYDLMY